MEIKRWSDAGRGIRMISILESADRAMSRLFCSKSIQSNASRSLVGILNINKERPSFSLTFLRIANLKKNNII